MSLFCFVEPLCKITESQALWLPLSQPLLQQKCTEPAAQTASQEDPSSQPPWEICASAPALTQHRSAAWRSERTSCVPVCVPCLLSWHWIPLKRDRDASLLLISYTPHGGLEMLMISDKMQMIQLSDVQVSFMLASSAAFSVSVGHIFLFDCNMQKNSTSFCKSEKEKEEPPVPVLVTDPLGSFRGDVKEKSLLLILADQPPPS